MIHGPPACPALGVAHLEALADMSPFGTAQLHGRAPRAGSLVWLLICTQLLISACGPGELELELTNSDTVPIVGAEVGTNGFSYPLPPLEPAQSTHLSVEAYGEGSLRLRHESGARTRFVLVPYFQAGDLVAVQIRLWRDSAHVRSRGRHSAEWSPLRSRYPL